MDITDVAMAWLMFALGAGFLIVAITLATQL